MRLTENCSEHHVPQRARNDSVLDRSRNLPKGQSNIRGQCADTEVNHHGLQDPANAQDAQSCRANDVTNGGPKIYGRHGDIHPGNLLYFELNHEDRRRAQGILKIADFGQAELNSKLSKTKTRSVAHTLTYRPPECDLQPKVIGQVYDIWCLGCVYLEFITWTLGGAELLTRFAQERLSPDYFQDMQKTDTFFEVVQHPITRKPRVKVKDKVIQVRDSHNIESAVF
jgi:serine/threonine protein kinase